MPNTTFKDVALDVTEQAVCVQVRVFLSDICWFSSLKSSKYFLYHILPYPVNEKEGKAQWLSDKNILQITVSFFVWSRWIIIFLASYYQRRSFLNYLFSKMYLLLFFVWKLKTLVLLRKLREQFFFLSFRNEANKQSVNKDC